MLEQLQKSKAQLVSLAGGFAWAPEESRLSWHDEIRGRAETMVHLRAPLGALAFEHKNIGEEGAFLFGGTANDVVDTTGIFLHVRHGANTSSCFECEGARRPGSGGEVLESGEDVLSEGLRSLMAFWKRACKSCSSDRGSVS
mmetsp:Transcript_55595/g.180433  ORF Transcript_55595/g.180433 Transcript_55595/m.180433 type:complete len:142 (-) Transcript_55595:684-1109(-)